MQQTTLQDLQGALQYLDPNCSRDEWVKVGMGIKNEFGDTGFDAFDSWSAGSEQYKPSDIKSTWRSIKTGGGTTIKTVFKMAIDNGFTVKREPISPEEQARLNKEFAQRAKKREAQEAEDEASRQRWHGVIADFSKILVEQFTKPVNSNKYLATKKVASFGLSSFKSAVIVIFRPNFTTETVAGGKEIKQFFADLPDKETRDFSFLHFKRGDLVMPLIDINKALWNIQVINEQGTKLFLKHGRKAGLFHFIGKASSCNILAVCEGYATGASIHMATKWPCAVALDAGNLMAVATELKHKLADKTFIFCADDDANTNGNPGVSMANDAAAAVGGLVAIPDFAAVVDKAA